MSESPSAAAGEHPCGDPQCDADHDWRRQMEAYGFDSVSVVLERIEAARRESLDTLTADEIRQRIAELIHRLNTLEPGINMPQTEAGFKGRARGKA